MILKGAIFELEEIVEKEKSCIEIEKILSELKKENIRMAALRHSDSWNGASDKMGWEKYFDVIIFESIFMRSKTDPEGLLKAARKLKIHPEECIGFGCSKENIRAINSAGMVSFGIGDADILSEAEYVMENLTNWEVIINIFRSKD